MNTLELLELTEEIDGLLQIAMFKKTNPRDPFAPHEQELQLRAACYDRWDRQVSIAKMALENASRIHGHLAFAPSIGQVPAYMDLLNKAFSGRAITDGISHVVTASVAQSFVKGKSGVDAEYRDATGNDPAQKDAMFGALFGLTEQHALQALSEQMMVAAGSFWDDQMQESIKREMESWFQGTITREDLTTKLMEMVNTRLATEGRSLARSYFDNLSTHIVNRSRNIGSFYRAKSLGVESYTLYNPHDNRTSEICTLVTQGQVYQMAHAEGTVTNQLQGRTSAELQATAPFLTTATAPTATGPVPPLHFPKCRTKMKFIF